MPRINETRSGRYTMLSWYALGGGADDTELTRRRPWRRGAEVHRVGQAKSERARLTQLCRTTTRHDTGGGAHDTARGGARRYMAVRGTGVAVQSGSGRAEWASNNTRRPPPRRLPPAARAARARDAGYGWTPSEGWAARPRGRPGPQAPGGAYRSQSVLFFFLS